jgi:periplasmic divalent cation tolerance protein
MSEMASSVPLVEIVTTLAREEDAARIARALVEERLAACGSWGTVRSTYAWKGAIVDEPEIELVIKTTAQSAERAEHRLRDLHPYETPAILRRPILAANADYALWVRESVRGDDAV